MRTVKGVPSTGMNYPHVCGNITGTKVLGASCEEVLLRYQYVVDTVVQNLISVYGKLAEVEDMQQEAYMAIVLLHSNGLF